ncbi:MAG: L,D-transpeptidase [Acidimicrobiia bacterium]|nr:L,D-transpeptidase [Acidimicrobiia bacterium]
MSVPTRRFGRGLLGPLVALVVLGAACSGGGGSEDSASTEPVAPTTTVPPTTAPAPSYRSVVATAQVPEVAVFAEPGAADTTYRLANPTETGGPLVFLVDEQLPDGWINVLLPVRPNGTTGWVRAEDVELATNDFRVTVELDAHRITLTRGEEVLVQEPVGVGRGDAPTPGGRFYIKELLQPPEPGSVYGPYAYGLSGFSNVLESFNGGDGVIGIHGNNDPSSIGGDVSSGCIRLHNDVITRMVEEIGIPLGTPVEVVA